MAPFESHDSNRFAHIVTLPIVPLCEGEANFPCSALCSTAFLIQDQTLRVNYKLHKVILHRDLKAVAYYKFLSFLE